MKQRNKWCHVVGFLLGSVGLAPILVMYCLTDGSPLELIEGNIAPYNVRAGQEVRVTWTAKELRACDGEVYRVFIDSAKTVYPTLVEPTVYHQTFADRRTFQKLMVIPAGMTRPVPRSTSAAPIERWCNPMQKYIWPIRSEGASNQVQRD